MLSSKSLLGAQLLHGGSVFVHGRNHTITSYIGQQGGYSCFSYP